MSARASLRSTGTQLRTDSGRFRTSRVRVCVTVVNGYATADRFGLVCEEKKMRGGPISRVLSGATIYLLRTSPSASSALPERSAGHTIALLHAFAPEGACQAAVLPRRWWSLTPPFQLFSHPPRRAAGVFFSAALSVGSPRQAVSLLPALWSPDFPHGVKDAPRSPGPPRVGDCITHPPL